MSPLAFEADMIVSELLPNAITFEAIGTERWYRNHENLERLNIQAHWNVQAQCEEFVTETFLTHSKIEFLIKDLLTIEAWKTKVFPRVTDAASGHSIKSYMILYHEATLVNLLEILFYNKQTVLQAEDTLVDLVDYCHRKMNYLTAWEPKEEPLDATAVNNQSNKDSLLNNYQDLNFSIAINSLSIFRYITDQVAEVPLSVLTRILNFNDMICSCVYLIECAPWLQKEKNIKSGKPQYSSFENGSWKSIAVEDMQKLGKVEAQVWLALYNLLLDNECRRKLVYTDHNKSVILRLRPYVEPILVDQLPVLSHVQRHLDELLIMDVPTSNPEGSSFLIEQVPEVSNEINSQCNVKELSARFKTLIKDENQGTGMNSKELAKSMAAMYDLDSLDALLDDPKCGKCGRPAENRCSKCKCEWYCSRQCQVQAWQKHKSICVMLEESNRLKALDNAMTEKKQPKIQEL
ncbi:hypothetical protein BC830DRAFT_887021 [Chytriomyces sp. MP71]|nr:hypothetical protein BC830DRAFT_887021 [Chytriomyces sp. MP71]